MKKNADFLGTENIWKLVISIAIPSMLAQFVNVLYSIVDRIYIGNMAEVGEIALASVGICGPIVTLISSFAFLVGLGGAPLFSIRLGEKNKNSAEEVISTCFFLLIILSVILTIVVFVFKTPMLYAFGASENLIVFADEYLSYYAAGTIFAILSVGLNCFIIAQGFAKVGMITVLIGAVLNIILDPIFIFGFNLGVKGAAIATVIAQALSAAFAIIFLFRKNSYIQISINKFKTKIIAKILALGFSPFLIIATDSLMLIVLNTVLQKYGGDMGDTIIAGATIMLSFMQIVTMPLGGITSGTQPILSYNFGAKNTARVKKGQINILILCVIFTTIMFFIARFLSKYFVMIFTKDPYLIQISEQYIHIYTLAIIPLAFQYAFVDGLTALGIAPVAITLSLTRKILVMLSLTIILPKYVGVLGAFYAEPIADVVSFIVSTLVYSLLINKILKRRENNLI